VQNDKDHAKIFKKLQKLWGLVNSMGNQGLESPMITKQPYKQQACLACDHNIANAVRILKEWTWVSIFGPSGPWKTPVRESNGAIARDERVYHMGGGFDSNTIHVQTSGIGGSASRANMRPGSAKISRPMHSNRKSV